MNEERWLETIRTQLDADARALDAATASKLTQARARAVAERPRARWLRVLVPAFGVAAAFALALPLWRHADPAPPATNADSFELLVAGDDVALYDDLEFYAWLGAEGDADAGG
jgi:hypothetical protein